MTENKRFTIDECGNIADTVTNRTLYVENRYTECKYYVNLLNELNDENEQLKQDLKIIEEHRKQETEYTARLEEENKQLQKDCTALIYNNQEYRKENEQLKQRIKQLEDNIVTKLNIIQGDME